MAAQQNRKTNTGSRRTGYAAATGTRRRGLGETITDTIREMTAVSRDETKKIDQSLLWIILILFAVGTLMMFSASYAYAYDKYDDSMYFFKKQFIFGAIGIVGMLIVSSIPAQRIKNVTMWTLAASFAMLVAVLFFPAINHAHRWMLGFQPSEFTKFAVILFCASWADTHSKQMGTFKYGVLPFVVVVGATAVLLFVEPHVSCTIIVLLLTATLMFVGGVDRKWFIGLGGLAGVAVLIIATCRNALEQNHFFARIYGRIDVWQDPFKDPLGDGWQNIQALYAISSGGLTGQGIGNSRQKYLYISEPQNDFIFSVICEEIGFIGAAFIILLFMIFVWRGFSVSVSNTNRFSKLLGIGITAQVGWQALLNVMVVTQLAPNTGISLPFFSYGGSSLVMLLLEMGVLLSISRSSSIKRV